MIIFNGALPFQERTSLKYKNESWRFCIHDSWWCSYFKKWWFSTATLDNQEAPKNIVSTEKKLLITTNSEVVQQPQEQRCLTPRHCSQITITMVPVPVGGPKGAKGPREGVEQRPYDSTVDDCKNLGAKKIQWFITPKSNGESSILILLPSKGCMKWP